MLAQKLTLNIEAGSQFRSFEIIFNIDQGIFCLLAPVVFHHQDWCGVKKLSRITAILLSSLSNVQVFK